MSLFLRNYYSVFTPMLMEYGKTVGHSLRHMNIHEHLHTQTTVLRSHVGHARVGPVCGVGACLRGGVPTAAFHPKSDVAFFISLTSDFKNV